MNTISDTEIVDAQVGDAYYPTFVVNRFSHVSSLQDSAHSSPRPSSPWPSPESMSDSCSGTWSSPTPSIAYSLSPRPTHYRNIHPTWSDQEAMRSGLQPFESLDQVPFQAYTSAYFQQEPVCQPYYENQYFQIDIPGSQEMEISGMSDWATAESVSSERFLESSPAPSSETASTVISANSSPARESLPLIKQEAATEHHQSCPKSSSAGKRHTAKVTRAYPCPFLPYDCAATFSSKNEWKRHINTQHLSLSIYRCDLCTLKTCSSSSPQQNNDFNRKDLFIQHLRRMHCDTTVDCVPASNTVTRPSKYMLSNTLATLAEQARRCHIPPPSPPSSMNCIFCCYSFSGPQAWAQRTEHISRHLEMMRRDGKDIPKTQEWRRDEELEAWCLARSVLLLQRSRDGRTRIRVKNCRLRA